MSGVNELTLSNIQIKLFTVKDKVVANNATIRLYLAKHGNSGLDVDTSKVNEVIANNATMSILLAKKEHPVSADFRTVRTLGVTPVNSYLQFDKEKKSYGEGPNPLAGGKEFTVSFTFSTTDDTPKGTQYYYDVPWLFGTNHDGSNSGDGGFAIGTDKGFLYIWSGMGKGADI